MEKNVLAAFLLTTMAGLATGIGSLLAFFARKTNRSFLSVALGFSAGVMIYISFVEILPTARESLTEVHGESAGAWLAAMWFFVGVIAILIIDMLVPETENPHAMHPVEEMSGGPPPDHSLLRVGLLAAIAIAIHNFPEGIATFTVALQNPAIGLPIAIAIAVHNIPEGISVSVPIFFATGSRKKAFWLSFVSGLSEPLGAAAAYLVLRPFLSAGVFGSIFAAVAGVMVYVSLDELLPGAREHGKGHLSILGLIVGMAVMAVTLLITQ